MAEDLVDRLLSAWDESRPDLDVGALQVTARLSRIGAHLARRQEAVFERFGLGRGEVGLLSALRISGPPHRLSPSRLGRGLMLSSAGVTSRLDRLERRGLLTRTADTDDRRGVVVELTDEGLRPSMPRSPPTPSATASSSIASIRRRSCARGILRKLLGGLELPD